MKLVMHEQGPANPIIQYMAPKVDGALDNFQQLTGLRLPIEQTQYQNIVFVAGSLELLGGVLFTLNVKLGSIILVGSWLCSSYTTNTVHAMCSSQWHVVRMWESG